nr:HAD family hydrolase [Candidatus Woesearchaeota archaeon]
MNNEIEAVGFDLDNTLYVKNPIIDKKINDYICLKASNILKKELIEVKTSFQQKYSELHSSHGSLMAIGIENEDLAISIVQEALENADISSSLSQDVKLNDMLKKLSKYYRLFMITGSRKDLAIKKLDALGIDKNLFYPSLYAYSIYERYNGSAFSYVSSIISIPPNRIMFVGDREKSDILPAKKLGIKTAIVNSTSQFADYNLKTIYDLEEILLKK